MRRREARLLALGQGFDPIALDHAAILTRSTGPKLESAVGSG